VETRYLDVKVFDIDEAIDQGVAARQKGEGLSIGVLSMPFICWRK